MMERYFNKTRNQPPYHVSGYTREVHNRLIVVDLHADSLLWNRDLLKRSSFGHIDYDRLIDGNVAVQVFGVVTKFPIGLYPKYIPLSIDLVTLLSIIHRWPRQTRRDLFQRAIYQSMKLGKMIIKSNGKIMLIKSVKDLDQLLALRMEQPRVIGSLLALEGTHALNGDMTNLEKLYNSGFRIIGISHFFDNEAGGSAHGQKKEGLSEFGYRLVRRMHELHMIIDLSHASERVVDEVTEIAKKPVIVSHTGVRRTCDSARNISDDRVKRIARGGGMVGIAMFKEAVCGTQIKDTVRAIRYVADLVGVDHVGIGSDFDGAITAPVDTTGLPLLTEELLSQGLDEDHVTKIMGGNALRVFHEVLPKE